MDRQNLVNLIKKRNVPAERFNELVQYADEVCDAFDTAVKDLSEEVTISKIDRISGNRVYVTLSSISFSHSYDTTVLNLFLNERNLVEVNIDCNIVFDFELSDNEKFLEINDSFVERLAGIFAKIYESESFRNQIRTIEMLQRNEYRLTVFKTEVYRYLPDDLYVDVSKLFVNTFRGKNNDDFIEIPKSDFTVVNQFDDLTAYLNHYGVINGFIVILHSINQNQMVLQLIKK